MEAIDDRSPRLTSPKVWSTGLAAAPVLCSEGSGWAGALVRRWRGIDREIVQPALNQHYLSMHLGGPKFIIRRGEGMTRDVETAAGALSLIPAGAAFDWDTTGPIDFAHLYLSPVLIRQIGIEVFDRDYGGHAIEDPLGFVDPVLQSLFEAMLDELETPAAGTRVYLDTLFRSLAVRLLRLHGGGKGRMVARQTIAPLRLRRVFEFIEANLAADIGVADMAAIAAISQFHFSRAFSGASGSSPYAYLTARRIMRAKLLLKDPDLSIAAVAAASGFQTTGQFSRMFKRLTATSPRRYRRDTQHG